MHTSYFQKKKNQKEFKPGHFRELEKKIKSMLAVSHWKDTQDKRWHLLTDSMYFKKYILKSKLAFWDFIPYTHGL